MILLKNQTISLSTKLLFPFFSLWNEINITIVSTIFHPSIHPSIIAPWFQRMRTCATARIRSLSTDSYSNNNIICERVEGNRIPPCFSLDFKPFRHEIFRRSSGDNVVFYFSSPSLFSSSLPPFFFFLFFPPPSIDYRYPIEDSTKLSGEVRASACSFALAVSRGLVLALMSDDKGFQR